MFPSSGNKNYLHWQWRKTIFETLRCAVLVWRYTKLFHSHDTGPVTPVQLDPSYSGSVSGAIRLFMFSFQQSNAFCICLLLPSTHCCLYLQCKVLLVLRAVLLPSPFFSFWNFSVSFLSSLDRVTEESSRLFAFSTLTAVIFQPLWPLVRFVLTSPVLHCSSSYSLFSSSCKSGFLIDLRVLTRLLVDMYLVLEKLALSIFKLVAEAYWTPRISNPKTGQNPEPVVTTFNSFSWR